MKLILASASPRRRELFDLLKLDHMVIAQFTDTIKMDVWRIRYGACQAQGRIGKGKP